MKRAFWKVFAVLVAALFLAGCAGMQIGGDDAAQTVLYKLAGHRFGFELGKKDPQTAAIVAKAADGIIMSIEEGTTSPALSALLQEGLAKLAAGYANDPALAAEVAIVAELVIYPGGIDIDTEAYKVYLKQMRAGLEGFKMGYTLALAVAK